MKEEGRGGGESRFGGGLGGGLMGRKEGLEDEGGGCERGMLFPITPPPQFPKSTRGLIVVEPVHL